MIFSDRQYAVSKQQLKSLTHALTGVQADSAKHPRLQKIESNALQSQISEIEHDLKEYELLKSGSIAFTETYALSDLPRILIQARIALGMSQTDLAEQLNMKPQQVQRYEASDYMGASLARVIEIANVLHVRVSQSFQTSNLPSGSLHAWSNYADVDWARFPVKEMAKRGWIKGKDLVVAARDYFLEMAGPQFATALHRKKVRSGNSPNEFALLAWQARVLEKAKHQCNKNIIVEFKMNDTWLRELVALTKDPDGPRKSRNLLAEHGIVLVIEKHLSGTYLDGAAMKSAEGQPVVAMTLRHDRLDNFWFVLFHEIAHVYLHLNTALHLDFFDEEDGAVGDSVEKEADSYALDKLIPESAWKQCLSRFAISEEAVLIDADKLGIDASIIAGRIRKERGNYTILNNLIGSGVVRAQFEEAYQ